MNDHTPVQVDIGADTIILANGAVFLNGQQLVMPHRGANYLTLLRWALNQVGEPTLWEIQKSMALEPADDDPLDALQGAVESMDPDEVAALDTSSIPETLPPPIKLSACSAVAPEGAGKFGCYRVDGHTGHHRDDDIEGNPFEWADAPPPPTKADHETDIVWQGYSIKGYIQDGSYYAEVDKLDGGASTTWSLSAATGAMDDFEQNLSDDIEEYLTAKAFRIWYNHIDQCSTEPPTFENVRDVAADFMEGTYFVNEDSHSFAHVWANPRDGQLMLSTTSGASCPVAELSLACLEQFTLLGELQS